MGSCSNKRKDTCGKKVNSVCVKYEGEIPEESPLSEESCPVVEEVLEDLYSQYGNPDLSALGNCGVEYEQEGDELLVPEALLGLEAAICEIKGEDSGNGGTNISFDINNIDTKCLVNPCGTPITNLEQLLQAMIDKICDCCGE